MKITDLLTTNEGAKYLGVNERTLRRHVDAGNLKPALDMSGRGYWFRREDLDKLKAETGFKIGRPKTGI